MARKARILVVDDERPVLDVMDEALRDSGYETVVTTSPETALRKVRMQKFDAAVLDIVMQEMSGLLLHAKIRVVDRTVAENTLFVSGNFTNEELRRNMEGSPRFLRKPFSLTDFVRAVAAIVPPLVDRAPV